LLVLDGWSESGKLGELGGRVRPSPGYPEHKIRSYSTNKLGVEGDYWSSVWDMEVSDAEN
jgi:hypothetical protein